MEKKRILNFSLAAAIFQSDIIKETIKHEGF